MLKLFDKYKTALAALLARGASMGLQFATSLVLVRALGASGMGIYSLYNSWMQLLSSVAGMGTTTHSLRTVSVLAGRHDYLQIKKFLFKLSYFLVGAGAVLILLIWPFSGFLSGLFLDNSQLAWMLTLSAFAALIFMLFKIYAESLKALRLVNTALLCESGLLSMMLIVIGGIYIALGWSLEIERFLMLHIGVLLVTTLVMLVLIFKTINSAKEQRSTDAVSVMHVSLLPLWGSGLLGMWFMNMPILLLPHFTTTDEIGVFSMAYRLITIAVNILMVLASIYGPRFARDFAVGNVEGLRQGLRQTRLISMLIYFPLFILFVLIPGQVMQIFGKEFASGGQWLLVMALGQMVYASTGLVGYMMNMIHQDRQEFWIMLSASIFMLISIVVLGHWFGTTGVAGGFAMGLAMKNLTSMYFAHYHLRKMSSLSI